MKQLYFFFTLAILASSAYATAPRDRIVTLHAKNQPLESIFDSISQQTGFTFSYSSSIVNASQLTSIEVENKPANEVLLLLLNNKYEYKIRRNHIIIKKHIIKNSNTQSVDYKDFSRKVEDYSYITNQLYVKKLCYSDSGTVLGDCLISTNTKKDDAMKKHLATLMLACVATVSAQAQDSTPTNTVKEQVENIGKSFSSLVVEVAESATQAIKIAADEVNNQVAQLKISSSDKQGNESSVAVEEKTAQSEPVQNELKVEPEKQNEKQEITPEKQETAAPEPATPTPVTASAPKTDSVRPFLFTIIYPFSFPELQPERHTYNFSLNLLAGYNGGVEGCELGYLANVNRYGMKGFQAAGVTNVSLGSVEGMQLAGVVNVANKSTDNVQWAGVSNVSLQGSNTLQVGGVLNVAHTAKVQLSGVTNAALQSDVQLGGVLNAAMGKNSAQISGVVNVADTSTLQLAGVLSAARQSDVQISGIVNASLGKNSTQISGIVNVADTSAAQIGGVVNVARKAGTQIGLVNVADTVSGVMVGLVNYARRGGLRQFEVSAGGTSSVNAAFRMGTKKLYTFYEASWDFENEVWRQGLGLGTQITFPKNWGMNIEALHQSVSKNFFEQEDFNGLTQLRVVGYKQFAKHLSLFAGPSLYVYNSDSKGSNPIALKFPYTLYSNHNSRISTDILIGATVGVRF